jgi:transcriptional regulator with XRE-family HTH domain
MNNKLTRIKEYRKESGATIIDIARATGLSRKAIYEIENGYTLPRYQSLIKLADYFGLSVADYIKAVS